MKEVVKNNDEVALAQMLWLVAFDLDVSLPFLNDMKHHQSVVSGLGLHDGMGQGRRWH
jgi:hypothetical protein